MNRKNDAFKEEQDDDDDDDDANNNQSIPFLIRVTEFYKKDELLNRLFMENLEIVQTVLLAYTTQRQKHENSLSPSKMKISL